MAISIPPSFARFQQETMVNRLPPELLSELIKFTKNDDRWYHLPVSKIFNAFLSCVVDKMLLTILKNHDKKHGQTVHRVGSATDQIEQFALELLLRVGNLSRKVEELESAAEPEQQEEPGQEMSPTNIPSPDVDQMEEGEE
ncbi:hypothetical protein niasHT_034142 [Heterodera trifolii]|uniref:F-box domain-containing protein n=1 Tax=Heterodera trifolii TaxID=157864 RepID=A0ABD2J1C8_9BILA